MKTFLSIGTGPGMGLATAEHFAKEGYQIILSARNRDKLAQLERQLKAKGYQVAHRLVDVAKPHSVVDVVDEVTRTFGAIDVLHYNAAAMRKQSIDQQDYATFNQDLAINIGGALAAIKAAETGMAAAGQGTILLTGGGFALAPHADFLSLSLGKAGIRALALGLFESFKQRNIHLATVTVNAFVEPGSQEAAAVAQQFWELAAQAKEAWAVEARFDGL